MIAPYCLVIANRTGGATVIEWVSLRDAAALVPSKPAKETVRLWVTRGMKRSDGALVKLKAHRIGGRWFTRKRWLRQYMTALQAVEPVEVAATAGAFSAADWEAEQQAAAKKLGRATKGKT
jgi:hypothetical protein